MIYLELKKKALAVIFSQVKIIRAKGYIGELVRSAAEAISSEPIASEDYSHEQGIATVTPTEAIEIAAGDLQRSDGSAVLELITTLTVSALDTPSREHGTAWIDHATTTPIYAKTHVGEETSAKLGMIQNATIDDYSGEVISSLYGKTVDEIATIIIL